MEIVLKWKKIENWCGKTSILYMINHSILKKEMRIFFLLMLQHYHCFAQMCLLIGTVSQMSDVGHGPLVYKCNTNDNILHIIKRLRTKINFSGFLRNYEHYRFVAIYSSIFICSLSPSIYIYLHTEAESVM